MRPAIIRFASGLLLSVAVSSTPALAATITVTSLTDGAAGTPPGAGGGVAGDLRHAILSATSGDVIEFACATAPCTITLNGPLPPIRTSVTINGGARGRIIIDGQNLYRALFADNGTIDIRNLRIQNVRAKGGNGGNGGGSVSAPGGGGAGLGAGLFVSTAAIVTVTDVDFANLAAVGGTGGSSVSVIGPASGGGGGLGGDGGHGQTGGNGAGGGGVLGAGDSNTSSAGGNGGLGGGGGGAGDRPGNPGGTGGTGYGSTANGASGNSADSGIADRGAGGNGGFGGGGGGAPNPSISGGQSLGLGAAGNGGFGGGGGGADQQTDGGIPGGGGGGGGSSNLPVSGGVLMSGLRGGQGNNSRAGGGGGAAAGPAIFVYQGTVTIATSTVENATATGGAGGTATWNPGLGGTAGGADASPVFNYDGNVNGTTDRGPVTGLLVGGWQGLTVTRDGTGSGTVTASAGGLNCPGTCTADVGTYTDVTLTATPATGSTFTEWSGNCGGTTASVTLTNVTAPQACTATFTLAPVPPPTPTNPVPAPIPSFVATPVPPAIDAPSAGSGSGSVSLAASFPNPSALSFTVGTADGGPLPSWLTFDPATATFTYQVLVSPEAPFADKVADVRSSGPNTIYPPALRAAKIPVSVSATGNGQTYAVMVEMSFFRPRPVGVIAAASLGLDGTAGNAAAGRSSLSYDGGQVVFESGATNMFPGSANSFTDILRYHGLSGMRDRLSQTAIPGGGVANAADGASVNPAVSADGRWAVFASDAPGITLKPSGHTRQVYRASLVYPRVPLNEAATPAPVLVSATAAGIIGNGLSDNPSLSQDGRFVAFDSVATNFAANLDPTHRVWRKDLATGELIEVATGRYPSISWDGNRIAYEADGVVHLADIAAGTRQAIGSGTGPKLSAKGDRVVFVNAGKVMLGGTAVADGDQPGISADGRFVVYRAAGQIRVIDVDRGATALVSQTAAGVSATGDSANPSISGDGSTISFTSTARDLVGGNLAAGQLYLAANPLPLPDKTGYWYQADAANGQGWVMERWGAQAYVGGLVYDGQGRATWTTGFCTLKDLACQGTLSSWAGGTAFGAAGPGAPVPAAGPSFTVTTDGRNQTLTVGSASMTLSPFPIGGTATTAYAGVPQAGWWYEPASGNSGNGYFLGINTQVTASGAVQQVAYLSILTFDGQGRAVWYAAQGALGPGLSATLYQYSGGASVSGTAVGQVRLSFDGSDRAILNLPNGRTAGLTRWRF